MKKFLFIFLSIASSFAQDKRIGDLNQTNVLPNSDFLIFQSSVNSNNYKATFEGVKTNILNADFTNWVYTLVGDVNRNFYFSSVTNGVDAVTNCTSMIDFPVAAASTNSIPISVVPSYFISRLSTNSISRIEAGPINLQTYLWITGAGGIQSVTAHPEIYLWFTNDTILEIASSGDQVFTESAVPSVFNIGMNVVNSTNLPTGTKLMLRWQATAIANSPTFNFAIGGDYDSHISVNIPSTTLTTSYVSNGALISSNSWTLIPSLNPGDNFYCSSNGIPFVIWSDINGTLSTNRLIP